MNKISIVFVTSLLLLASCAKDGFLKDEDQQLPLSFSTVKAIIGEMADTRAYLVNDNSTKDKFLSWGNQDAILVYSNLDNRFSVYYFLEQKDGKGIFNGNEVRGNQFYGLHPASCWSIDSEKPHILHFEPNRFSSTIASSNNDFRSNAPMVAISSDNNYTFKQTTGLIHISIKNAGFIESIMFRGNNNEILNSTGYIDLSEEQPVFRFDQTSNNWIQESHVLISYLSTNEKDVDLYYMLPPMTFENGFTVSINGLDQKGENVQVLKSTDKKVVIERARVKNFALIDINAELN